MFWTGSSCCATAISEVHDTNRTRPHAKNASDEHSDMLAKTIDAEQRKGEVTYEVQNHSEQDISREDADVVAESLSAFLCNPKMWFESRLRPAYCGSILLRAAERRLHGSSIHHAPRPHAHHRRNRLCMLSPAP